MSHYRQQILSSLRTIADGIPSNPAILEASVFKVDALPAVAYELDEDEILETNKDDDQEHELTLTFTVAADSTGVRDQIALELEQAMISSPIAADQSFEGTELLKQTEGEVLLFGAVLQYTIRIVVAGSDPTTIL